MAWLRRYRDQGADFLGTTRGWRHRDLFPSLFALGVTLGGLTAFVWLLWKQPDDWAWMWVAASVAVIAGVVTGAPAFAGRTLIVASLAGVVLGAGAVLSQGRLVATENVRADAIAEANVLYLRISALSPALSRSAIADLHAEVARIEAAAEPSRPLSGIAEPRWRAENLVAQAELRQAQTDDDRAAAREAVTAAHRAVGSRVEGVEVVDALKAGAGDLVGDLLPAEGRQVPLVFAAFGLILAGAAALALMRWTAVRNATQGLGPVSVEAADDTDHLWPECRETFRTFLLENVPEPGTVPGSEAVVKVAELAGAIAPDSTGKSFQAALQALAALMFVPRGYVVQVGMLHDIDAALTRSDTEPPNTTAPATTAVTGLVVRVRAAHGHTLLGQREFGFPAPAEHARRHTLREAAFWAAAVVLEESRAVPAWARWSRETFNALAAYAETQAAAGGNDAGKDPPATILTKAERLAPNSALVMLHLALALEEQQHGDTDGDFITALAHSIDAVGLYRRYVEARYRAASEADLLALEVDRGNFVIRVEEKERGEPSADKLEEIKAEFERIADLRERYVRLEQSLARYVDRAPQAVREAADSLLSTLRSVLHDPTTTTADDLRDALLAYSLAERVQARRQVRLVRVAANAVRNSERSYWFAHRRSLERHDWRDTLRSAELLTRYAQESHDHEEPPWPTKLFDRWLLSWVEGRAERRAAFWQLPYNLACYHCRQAEAAAKQKKNAPNDELRHMELEHQEDDELKQAVAWLERARLGRDNHHMTAEWLRVDPDLKSLRDERPAWFTAFLSRIRSREAEEHAGQGITASPMR
jgi:hypothetical protein